MQSVYRLRYSFFIFFLILLIIPNVDAEELTLTLTIVPEGDVGFTNDVISLDSTETLDLTSIVLDVAEFVEVIGSLEVVLTQQVRIVSITNSDQIVLENTDLTTVSVEIPDQTTISAPTAWDGILTPPITVAVTGTVDPAFVAPTTGILFGSPDVILVFDQVVTILLEGTTGQTAYKLPGENTWNLIDGCLGTYTNPTNPVFPNECSVTDGTDTKILTYHFTEFTGLEEIVEETTTSSTSGGGRTSTSPPNSGFSDKIKSSNELPFWLTHPVLWWNDDQITSQEFSSIMGWLIDEDIIKIEDKTKPEKQIITMAPSTKHLFSLWEGGIISESIIVNLIETYRGYGVW